MNRVDWIDIDPKAIARLLLEAKKEGFYMAAGLYGAVDPNEVELLWKKCLKKLKKELKEIK